jgi:hypothetical protein
MKEIKLIYNQPCKACITRNWSIRIAFVTATAGGEDEEGQEEKDMMKCRASHPTNPFRNELTKSETKKKV